MSHRCRIRHLAPLALLWVFALPLSARADEAPPDDVSPAPAPARVQPPEPPPRRVMPTPPQPRQAPRPAAPRPRMAEREYVPYGLVIAPELLGYRFSESKTEFADDAGTGDVLEVDPQYTPGGRLGVGYRWRNGWDVMARGTVVQSRTNDGLNASSAAGLATGFGAGFDNGAVGLDVDYSTLDLEAGYTLGDFDRHHVRVFFGARGARIDQTLSGVFDPDATLAGDRNFVSEELDSKGYGARAGLEAHLMFNRAWGFFLEGDVSHLWGTVESTSSRSTNDGATLAAAAASKDDTTFTVLGASTGFEWQHEAFNHGLVGIRVGWELGDWRDVPTPTDFASSSIKPASSEHFRADGPFVRAEFTF